MKAINQTFIGLIISSAACLYATGAFAQVKITPKQTTVNKDLPATITLSPDVSSKLYEKKIDLAAMSISFTELSCTNKFVANIKIEGEVKNIGGLNYESGARQQSAQLWEDGGGRPRLVARQPFQNLGVNEVVKVSFTRSWNKSSPEEGEFPPIYRLLIAFDPDILIDGNNNNDDKVTANDEIRKSGKEVNQMTFSCK